MAIVRFIAFVLLGVVGYVGWGDPVNWPLVLTASVIATYLTRR